MIPDPWWRHPGALDRVLCDLLAGELARLRPGAPGVLPDRPWPDRPWPADLPVDEQGLGADSLERLHLAAAVAELLQIHRSGIEDHLLTQRRFGGWVEVARTALARFDQELTFRTSGSTGLGTACHHPLAALEQEVRFMVERMPGRRRILTAVAAHHIYGFLFTILLPARLGIPVLDLRGRSPAALAALLEPGDLVVGHPEFWQAVLRTAPALPTDVAGTSSAAPCPAETARGLRALGLVRLVEIFGSSETAGLGWRDDPHAAFQPLPWWRFDADQVERLLPDGTVMTRPLQDRLVWQGDGFRPQGRRDPVVQVGGVNVSLERVRERLLRLHDVADCAVRLMRPDEGTRLKAFVVPAAGAPPEPELRARLTAWINQNLHAAERPKALSFGPALPVGELGKPADWPVPPQG